MVHPPDGGLRPSALMPEAAAGGAIRFTDDPADPSPADLVVVLDTTWTPPTASATATAEGASPGPGERVAVRDVAARVLSAVDPIAATSARLDGWAATSGVIERLTIRDTSFWFYVRLRHWMWLQERVVWAGIVDDLLRDRRPARIVCAPGTDEPLLDVLRLVARRDGIELVEENLPEPEPAPDGPSGRAPASGSRPRPASAAATATRPAEPAAAASTRPPSATARAGAPPAANPPPRTGFRQTALAGLARKVRDRFRGPPPAVVRRLELEARAARVRALVDALAAEPAARLLVVHEHARQLVDTPAGRRSMNPYLDPIVDRLRGTRLDPIVLDIRAQAGHDSAWERLGSGLDERALPIDALAVRPDPASDGSAAASPTVVPPTAVAVPSTATPATSVAVPAGAAATPLEPPAGPVVDPVLAAWRDALDCPIDAFGVDLGPLLAAEVATVGSRWMPGMRASIDRIQQFVERIRPAAILLADEYHRQDWMAAARAVGVPVVAMQHGMIYPHHNGYIHAARPDSLRLPQRTFVFGRWERDLLCHASVYRDDEVVVGGSPRLDLVAADPEARTRIRRELEIADGERLVLVSGTWGRMYRRFHYPIALAALVDRPLPDVHIVVKLHPGEPDEGPYRRIIEGAAAARGFAPPKVTTVKSIDLYRLLAAADAHLGIHSTVLTEAVVTRTPNLLADGVAGADLLGYVPAGVALPVRDGASLLAALDAAAAGVLTEADAAAFTDLHFEPGPASERIAADLEAWLA